MDRVAEIHKHRFVISPRTWRRAMVPFVLIGTALLLVPILREWPKAPSAEPTLFSAGQPFPLPLRSNFQHLPVTLPELSPVKLRLIRSKFYPDHPIATVSHLLHLLGLWGDRANFSRSDCISGPQMLDLLLGAKRHELYKARLFPAYRTVLGELQFGAYDPESARHIDQCLSTLAELNTCLDTELVTQNGAGTVRDALWSSVRNFSIQQELEWSTVAFARYLPPLCTWQNRWGETFSFEDLGTALLDREWGQGPCFGTHALYAMCVLVQVDDQYDILSGELRRALVNRLVEARSRLEKNQLPEGCWTAAWWRHAPVEEEVHSLRGAKRLAALATGHHLRWIVVAPREAIPPEAFLRKALAWCYQSLGSAPAEDIRKAEYFCPYSHCLEGLYEICLPDELVGGFVPSGAS